MLSYYVRVQQWLTRMKQRLTDDERGATALEYILLIAFIVVVIAGVAFAAGPKIGNWFEDVVDKVIRGGK